MYLIEKISKKISSKTADILNMDKDKQEILEYGALNFFHTLLTVMVIVTFGILTGAVLEILVISITAALLRQYSGGAHATSPYRCAVVSVFMFGGLSLIAKYLLVWDTPGLIIVFQITTFLFALFLLHKYAPADSPNKRITKPETILRLKKASFRFVYFLFALTVLLWAIYLVFYQTSMLKIIICIHIGMLWQSLSITPIIQSLIGWIDLLLTRFSFGKGGVNP